MTNHTPQYPQPTTAGMYGSLRRPATRQYSQRCDALPGEMCEHRMMADPAAESEGGGGGAARMSMMNHHPSLSAMMPPPMPSLLLPPLHATMAGPPPAIAAPPVGILRNRHVLYFT